MTHHVVMFSGGAGSWAAAKRVAKEHGTANLTLLFADTMIEDADLYRFLIEAAANIYRCAGRLDGLVQLAAATPMADQREMDPRRRQLARIRVLTAQVIPGLRWIADGRTPWDVFRDERYLGNSRVGLCSKVLKQQQVDAWLERNCDPSSTVVYVGIDWSEVERLDRLRVRRGAEGWDYRAPLCDAPYLEKPDVLAWMAREGIKSPRLYDLGFQHNNCGGGCVRAGIGHFAHLHAALPEVFAEWERNEQDVLQFLGRDDISILKDRRGGTSRPMTLTQLRTRLDASEQVDAYDIGGCGCLVDTDESASVPHPPVSGEDQP